MDLDLPTQGKLGIYRFGLATKGRKSGFLMLGYLDLEGGGGGLFLS